MLTICDSSEPNSSPCLPAVAAYNMVKCDGGPDMLGSESTSYLDILYFSEKVSMLVVFLSTDRDYTDRDDTIACLVT